MDRNACSEGGEHPQHELIGNLVKRKTTRRGPFSILVIWLSKSVKKLKWGVSSSDVSSLRRRGSCAFCGLLGGGGSRMQSLLEKELDADRSGVDSTDMNEDGGLKSCSSTEVYSSDLNDEKSHSSSEESEWSTALGLPRVGNTRSVTDFQVREEKKHTPAGKFLNGTLTFSETEMMKERFSKLLLGEDMSGCGNGVCTALAISNAITNLCATLFGQLWKLEPLPCEKRSMWQREMEWLLSVSDHIVEMIPSWQTFADGTKLEVMRCVPRSDLRVNLPALHKLDNMLLEILDNFENMEFWYVDQGILESEGGSSASFCRSIHRQDEKWWLPLPHVPPGGLKELTRKNLHHKRECANQILKAAMSINSSALDEMEVPDAYLEALPKTGRASLGDVIYQYITSEHFSLDCLPHYLDLSSEHQALEIANRVEASMHIWCQGAVGKPPANIANRTSAKSSWELVKEFVADGEKRELLAERAKNLLLCLKQKFPGLPQTTLDMSKIQYNKDVGKSILESYSRVLESIAFNIVARIDDLLYVDDLAKHSDSFSFAPGASVIVHKRISLSYPVPTSCTPYSTAFTSPSF